MSTKEKVVALLDRMTEAQLQGLLLLVQGSLAAPDFPETEPDDWDQAMIAASKTDAEPATPLDDFARELGFSPDELRL